MFIYILKREIDSSSLYFDNFCTKTDAGDKIKYSSIAKNEETQQENTTEIPLK